MGLGIRRPGYNIYVAGYTGTGKTSVIRTFLKKWSNNAKRPQDWIYVYNFQQNDNPTAISLLPGQGRKFAKLMDLAIEELQLEIPKALQSEDYENTVNAYISQNNEKQARKFNELEKVARKMKFQIKSSSLGIETIPIVDGRSLTEKEYAKLSDKERDKIEDKRSELEPQVLDFARNVRKLEIEAKEYVASIQKKIGIKVIETILENIIKEFQENKSIIKHLEQVKEHILENLLDFANFDELSNDTEQHPNLNYEQKDKFRKYKVNVFVDNKEQKSAPIVIESNPTFHNLFGKVEKNVEHGMFLTDFTMIQAGSIHKANGGYLVLEANDIFKLPFVWDTLKRILRNRKGFIEEIGEQHSILPTTALRPEPIPLDLKVIMIGSDEMYHMAYDYDDDFNKIFKIKADFDYKIPRNKANLNSYVSFIATRSHKENLLHFDKTGVAAIIEYGSRLVEDQKQLTAQFSEIKDLTIEADFIAREQNQRIVRRTHVESALQCKFHRVNLYERHLSEMISAKEIILTVDDECIGQVNGLSVFDLGDYSFGRIGRITCTKSVSDDGIINVERATKLSGNIHDKGVYILSGFINAILSKTETLPYSVSLCFEQSYGMIDGDSATAAELVAIFSSLSEIPIKQNLAITGSCNQLGEIQPVGGINEKIEGFFRTCKLIGKTNNNIVVIPQQNINNLMLSSDTRKAVSEGYIKIFPVKYFWQVFEIATDRTLGMKNIYDKEYTANSAIDAIQEKIKTIKH